MSGLTAGPGSRLGSGTVVLLNGASSSGKSSLALALQRRWPTPAFRIAADDVGAMRAVDQTWALAEAELAQMLRRTRAGFHRVVAGLASVGNDVIADHVLSEPWRLADCVALFDRPRVVFVGVRCEVAELTRRELARGDRPVGTAAEQARVVHAHGEYDVIVDTTDTSAEACAEEIMAALPGLPSPTAFERLHAASG